MEDTVEGVGLDAAALPIAGDGAADPTTLPCDYGQAFALLPAALLPERAGGWRFAMLGGGIGAVARSCAAVCGGSLRSFDSVELSADVIAAARAHFGLVDTAVLRTHQAEAAAWLRARPKGELECLLVDVVASDAPSDGLQMPPPLFVDPEFLAKEVRRVLSPGGIALLNVLGEGQPASRAIGAIDAAFGGQAVALWMDPAAVCVAFNDPAATLPTAAECLARCHALGEAAEVAAPRVIDALKSSDGLWTTLKELEASGVMAEFVAPARIGFAW